MDSPTTFRCAPITITYFYTISSTPIRPPPASLQSAPIPTPHKGTH